MIGLIGHKQYSMSSAVELAPSALGVRKRGFLLIGNLLSIPGNIALALFGRSPDS